MLTVKWLQVLLCIPNNWIIYQSFVCTQLNNQTVLFLTIQFVVYSSSKQHNEEKRRAKTSLQKYTSHFIGTFACERELETEQNYNILTPPPLLWPVSVVSFSFSRAAQPEAQGPSSLLDDGFLYCILSPTGLQNSIGGPESPFGRMWLSLPHLLRHLWYPTVWLLVLTELYNSSTSTQSPTQSLELHVWSSSSVNNCHAVQRSLSSGASAHECIMGFYFVPFHQSNPPTRSLSITGHWNVSLPSGASLCNGMFGRVEGQNTTNLTLVICLITV